MYKFTLPFPPSANRYWRSDRGRSPHLSDEARSYRKEVDIIVRQQTEDFLYKDYLFRDQLLGMHVDYYFPRRGSDLKNREKQLSDALQLAGIFTNDNQIDMTFERRMYDKELPRAVVYLCLAEDFRAHILAILGASA